MKRLVLMLSVVAFAATACSTPASEAPAATTTTTASSTPGGSDAQPDDPGTQPDGPLAPDFTLALANGDEFTLSAAVKPVYMVFWAEW